MHAFRFFDTAYERGGKLLGQSLPECPVRFPGVQYQGLGVWSDVETASYRGLWDMFRTLPPGDPRRDILGDPWEPCFSRKLYHEWRFQLLEFMRGCGIPVHEDTGDKVVHKLEYEPLGIAVHYVTFPFDGRILAERVGNGGAVVWYGWAKTQAVFVHAGALRQYIPHHKTLGLMPDALVEYINGSPFMILEAYHPKAGLRYSELEALRLFDECDVESYILTRP